MVTVERAETEVVGRIAYLDPSKQWGYLHGALGERVYFHATGVRGGVAALAPGAKVCYRIADGGDQLCATTVVLCAERGR